MITEEMRQVWYGSDLSFDVDEADKKIQRIIELHEQTKPKPEPVGYVKTVGGYPDESEHRAEWVVKYKELKDGQPLYTTPPTREPFSEDEVWRIYDEGDNVSSALEFARAVEQAHGIGV